MTGDERRAAVRARKRLVDAWRPALRRLWPSLVLVAAIMLLQLSWDLLDHTSPSWDQSHYLDLAFRYRQAFQVGLGPMIHAIYTLDPGRAPFYSVALIPYTALFGDRWIAGLLLNLTLMVVLLLSVGGIAARLFNERARLLAIVLVAVIPEIEWLARDVLQDFALVALTSLSCYLILRTDGFRSLTASLLLGVVIGLGTLDKVSFIEDFFGPFAVTAAYQGRSMWRAFRGRGADFLRRQPQLLRLVLSLVIGMGIAAFWYLPNWHDAVIDAFVLPFSSTDAFIATDQLRPRVLIAFVINLIDIQVSWFLVLTGLFAAVSLAPRPVRWIGARTRLGGGTERLLFLFLWGLVPFASLVLSPARDPRYMAPGLPAIAVLVAGCIASIGWVVLRGLAYAMLAVTVAFQVLLSSVQFRVPGLPEVLVVGTPIANLSEQIAYLPGSIVHPPTRVDEAQAVIDYLIARSRGPSGNVLPRRIAILELHPVVNGNTLNYYAEVEHVPFTFDTMIGTPSKAHDAELARQLTRYDFAFYLPQTREWVGRDYTPALFLTNFSELRRKFPGPISHIYVGPASAAGFGTTSDDVTVLQDLHPDLTNAIRLEGPNGNIDIDNLTGLFPPGP